MSYRAGKDEQIARLRQRVEELERDRDENTRMDYLEDDLAPEVK